MEPESEVERKLLDEFKTLVGPKKCKSFNETSHLMRFIRTRNNDVKDAAEVHSKYHEMHWKNAELFSRMTPMRIKHVYEQGIVTKLPGTDLQGRAIFFFRFANWDTEEASIDDVHLACTLLLEEMSYYPNFQENGVVMIHDYDGFGFSHFLQLNLKNFMRIIHLAQGTFPLKFKAFHEVNQPSLFWVLYKVFYPLLPNKMKKRVFMHGTDTLSLRTHFHPSVLPKSLGGSAEELSDKPFMDKLFKRNDYYSNFVPSA